MSNTKVLIGILSAAAIGAGVGLLFAPAKGSSSRKKLSKKSDEYTNKLSNKIDHVVDNFSKKFDSMSKEADKVVNRLKVNAEELKSKVN